MQATAGSAAEELREKSERLQLALASTGMGTWEMDLVHNRRIWSAETVAMHGLDLSDAQDRHVELTDALMHSEDRQRLSELHEKLRAGLDHYEFEYRATRNGETRWIGARGTVLNRNAEGPTRIVGVTADITGRKLAEEKKDQDDERLRIATEAADMFAWEFDFARGTIKWSANAAKVIGCAPDQLSEDAGNGAFFVRAEDRKRIMDEFQAALAAGEDGYSLEFAGPPEGPATKFWRTTGKFIRNAAGVAVLAAGVTQNITKQKYAERALHRQANLIELSFEPIFVWQRGHGIVEWNAGAEQVYGYSREEAVGRSSHELLGTVHPVPLAEIYAAHSATGRWSGEVCHTRKDGRVLTVECRQQLIESEGELLVLETNRDIGDRKEWETRQRLMNRELVHRVKNSFAVLLAILRSTLKSSPNPQDFAFAFAGRLHSLAAAQDILTASDWAGAELGALARLLLSHYVEPGSGRLAISGPQVILSADHAAPFGLILNELATNAIKHGALSGSRGKIDLSWRLSADPPVSTLFLTWRENDGPRIVSTNKRGFGSVIIERSLPNAKVERDFRPEGLVCTIELALAKPGETGRAFEF